MPVSKCYLSSNVVVVGLARSPLGLYQGALAQHRLDDTLAHVIHTWQTYRWPYAPFTPDALLLGCANQAGEDGRNIARLVALLAGLPASTVGLTYHALCLSGMAAWDAALQGLRSGQWRCVVVGAAEHMSRAPVACLPQHQQDPNQWQPTVFGWRFTNPKFPQTMPEATKSMVSLADQLAQRQGYTTAMLNQLSWQSRQQALAHAQAQTEAPWVVPYPPAGLKGDEALGKAYPQAGLSRLSPLEAEGQHTAGQVARWGDGGLIMALATQEEAARQGWPVLATVVGGQWLADAPTAYSELTHRVALNLLACHHLTPQALAHVELHEGFAATLAYTAQHLGMEAMTEARLNPLGGALALGMPQALAGLWAIYRLAVRLAEANTSGAVGLAASPGGLGQAYACVLQAE